MHCRVVRNQRSRAPLQNTQIALNIRKFWVDFNGFPLLFFYYQPRPSEPRLQPRKTTEVLLDLAETRFIFLRPVEMLRQIVQFGEKLDPLGRRLWFASF